MEDRVDAPGGADAFDSDRETFERVWRRVMPRPEQSPIRPGGRPEPPAGGPPTISRPPRPERTGDEETLRRMMDGEAEDERFCRALARRAPERIARTLRAIAADERRHERKLNAAYFILTGRRFRPEGGPPGRPTPDLARGLREQVLTERREAEAYRRAAERTGDGALRELFRDLAADEARHERALRPLLEDMR